MRKQKLVDLIGFGAGLAFFSLLAGMGFWGPAPRTARAGGALSFTIGSATPSATGVLVSTTPNSTLYAVVFASAATPGDFVKCFSSGTATGFVAGSEVGSTTSTTLGANIMLADVVASSGNITGGLAPTYPQGQFAPFGINAALGLVCFRSGSANTIATIYYNDR